MSETKEEYYSVREIASNIKAFLIYIRKKWFLLLLSILTGIGLGAVYYKIQKPRYEAVTTFILEEKSAGGGGLAGLASQFGFDIGGLKGGGSIFAGDNILDILKSKRIIHEVLLSKVDSAKGYEGETLADLFLKSNGWKAKWEKKSELNDINFANKPQNQKSIQQQDSVLNLIHDFLIKKSLSADRFNKKGSIIKVSVTATNSLFAKLMTERIVDAASKLYFDIKTGNAQANIAQMQRRSDSLLSLLNRKSFTAAATQPLDINPGIKTAIVPVEIATRDKAVLATLYAEVTKNLEASKLLFAQQAPVIQLLDRPSALLDDHKKGLAFLLIIGAISSAFVFVLGAIAAFLLSKIFGR